MSLSRSEQVNNVEARKEKEVVKIHKRLIPLLREVLIKYRPELLQYLSSNGMFDIDETTARDLEDNVLSNELCETGFREDDEPNQRGLDLEDLIADVLRPFM